MAGGSKFSPKFIILLQVPVHKKKNSLTRRGNLFTKLKTIEQSFFNFFSNEDLDKDSTEVLQI